MVRWLRRKPKILIQPASLLDARKYWLNGGRISFEQHDPPAVCCRVERVLVDGVNAPNIIMCEPGWALAYDDGTGQIRLRDDRRGLIVRFWSGKVELEWEDGVIS